MLENFWWFSLIGVLSPLNQNIRWNIPYKFKNGLKWFHAYKKAFNKIKVKAAFGLLSAICMIVMNLPLNEPFIVYCGYCLPSVVYQGV